MLDTDVMLNAVINAARIIKPADVAHFNDAAINAVCILNACQLMLHIFVDDCFNMCMFTLTNNIIFVHIGNTSCTQCYLNN